jgi:septum formation protein
MPEKRRKKGAKSSIRGANRVPILLASGSPRRKEMLSFLQIPYRSSVSPIEERWGTGASPEQVAVALAKKKAEFHAGTDFLVIAMDTIVAVGNRKLGKPKDDSDARRMLKILSNRMHRVITGVALCYRGKIVTASEVTRVWFRKLGPQEIDWYLGTSEVFDKAGSYAIQGYARIFVRKIDGCYFNVIGFPIDCFQRCLKKFGLTIFDLMNRGSELSASATR